MKIKMKNCKRRVVDATERERERECGTEGAGVPGRGSATE